MKSATVNETPAKALLTTGIVWLVELAAATALVVALFAAWALAVAVLLGGTWN
jgi:hypothetical protein